MNLQRTFDPTSMQAYELGKAAEELRAVLPLNPASPPDLTGIADRLRKVRNSLKAGDKERQLSMLVLTLEEIPKTFAGQRAI